MNHRTIRHPSLIAVFMMCFAFSSFLTPSGQVHAQNAGRKQLVSLVKQKIGRVNDLTINTFFGDFSGDGRDDALVVAYYASRGGGNSFEIDVMLFEGRASGFQFLRHVQDVYGQSPRSAKFSRGRVKITLTTLGPNEPRCCPTVPKEYVISAP